MTCAVLLFAWKDAIVKITAGYYSPILVIWVQLAFMSGIWLPILIIRHGWNQLLPRPLPWQIARGLSLITGMGLFYWSVMIIPLADATAVSFTSPLIVAALSIDTRRENWLASVGCSCRWFLGCRYTSSTRLFR